MKVLEVALFRFSVPPAVATWNNSTGRGGTWRSGEKWLRKRRPTKGKNYLLMYGYVLHNHLTFCGSTGSSSFNKVSRNRYRPHLRNSSTQPWVSSFMQARWCSSRSNVTYTLQTGYLLLYALWSWSSITVSFDVSLAVDECISSPPVPPLSSLISRKHKCRFNNNLQTVAFSLTILTYLTSPNLTIGVKL